LVLEKEKGIYFNALMHISGKMWKWESQKVRKPYSQTKRESQKNKTNHIFIIDWLSHKNILIFSNIFCLYFFQANVESCLSILLFKKNNFFPIISQFFAYTYIDKSTSDGIFFVLFFAPLPNTESGEVSGSIYISDVFFITKKFEVHYI